MPGKLFVLDGLDGSGKSTQTAAVARELEEAGFPVKIISFPDYKEESSALVRMYLNGEFADDPDEVNAYAASSFYAVDRYASFQKFWKKDYEAGHTILATRYVSSNAIHQMAKLPPEEWDAYLSWLADFEYNKLGLPRPDQIIFLDMSRDVADKLLLKRYGGDAGKEDIHERDRLYLSRCQRSAAYAAKKENWAVIPCDDGENPLPLEVITQKIVKQIRESL